MKTYEKSISLIKFFFMIWFFVVKLWGSDSYGSLPDNYHITEFTWDAWLKVKASHLSTLENYKKKPIRYNFGSVGTGTIYDYSTMKINSKRNNGVYTGEYHSFNFRYVKCSDNETFSENDKKCYPSCADGEEYVDDTGQCCPALPNPANIKDFALTKDECSDLNPKLTLPDGLKHYFSMVYYSECRQSCVIEKAPCKRGEVVKNGKCLEPEPEKGFCPNGVVKKEFMDCTGTMCIFKSSVNSEDLDPRADNCSVNYKCIKDGKQIDERYTIVSCGDKGEKDPDYTSLVPEKESKTVTKTKQISTKVETDKNVSTIKTSILKSKKEVNSTSTTKTSTKSESDVSATTVSATNTTSQQYSSKATSNSAGHSSSSTNGTNQPKKPSYKQHSPSKSAGDGDKDSLTDKLNGILDFLQNPGEKIKASMDSVINSDMVKRKYDFTRKCLPIRTIKAHIFNRDIIFMSQDIIDKYIYVDLFKKFIILIFVITAFKHAMRNS